MNSLLVKGVFQILLAFNIPIIALGQVAIGADDLLFDQESFTDSLSVLYPVDERAAETSLMRAKVI